MYNIPGSKYYFLDINNHNKLKKSAYFSELEKLQTDLVNIQEWVRKTG